MIVQTASSFVVCSSAAVLGEGDTPRAWAEKYVRKDPDLRFIQGNYVESEVANSNGHIFPLDELVVAQHSLAAKALNMMHREHYIVGSFLGAQLLHADGGEYEPGDDSLAAAAANPPYVEALAGMWHDRFPEEFFNIRRAHAEGQLFLSMEARPNEVSCPKCDLRTAFAGLESDTYCADMQGAVGPKVLHGTIFGGGAIIIPPVKPGWSRADVTAISKLISDRADEAEQIYDKTAEEAPHLGPREWESIMTELLVVSREFPPEKRKKMADKGSAMPDGSFPIANEQDLRNAIKAVGRSKNPGAARSHIKRRASALGLSKLVPKGW